MTGNSSKAGRLVYTLALSLFLVVAITAGSARAAELVVACGPEAGAVNKIFKSYETFGIPAIDACNQGTDGGLVLSQDTVNLVAPGHASGWIATAPPGMAIVGASVPTFSAYGVVGLGYAMHLYWTGGPYESVGNTSGASLTVPLASMSSAQFGWDLQCASSTPCRVISPPARVYVQDVQLWAADTVNPTIVANGPGNLWYQGSVGDAAGTRWVRGQWPIAFTASGAPSGILSQSASIDRQPVQLPLPPACPARNDTVWQQCPASSTWSPTVSLAGNGDQQLTLAATSAAGADSQATETIHVDTTQPTISLAGPTTPVSSTAGTPNVTVTATTGSSGLGAISCSVDGGPTQSYSSSPASIPVSGIGMHSVRCTASNRSYDSAGQVAVSTPAAWSVDIAQPTSNAVSFSDIAHTLKCTRAKARRRRHQAKLICHRRAHLAITSTKRVAYRRGTTVSGWLATSSGVALPGRTVKILTAPANGLGQWSVAAIVTTAANGGWKAALPAGPSRLVETAYAGDSTTLPSTSATIHLVVPAKVKIHISPRRTRWGGTIRISGRVLGGYLPAGKLLRLRIGVAGLRATVGIPSIRRSGRFRTTWTFSTGTGIVRYWFSVSTLNEADYPFAPASSRRVYVTVGPG